MSFVLTIVKCCANQLVLKVIMCSQVGVYPGVRESHIVLEVSGVGVWPRGQVACGVVVKKVIWRRIAWC